MEYRLSSWGVSIRQYSHLLGLAGKVCSPKDQVNNAELRIGQAQIVSFQADWLELQVIPERFSLNTTQPPSYVSAILRLEYFERNFPIRVFVLLASIETCIFWSTIIGSGTELEEFLRLLSPWGEWGEKLQRRTCRRGNVYYDDSGQFGR